MSAIVIRAERLSKRYAIGRRRRPATARDAVADLAARIGAAIRDRRLRRERRDEILALDDLSFDAREGEIVGIIGRNGAGKSTLLKILSRITDPTAGFVDVTGGIGALLEVGIGFHDDLTGRENTYLNGAMLGMRKADIDRRFDEIVAFAEVDRFIDTPVKHYSSGMCPVEPIVAAYLETHAGIRCEATRRTGRPQFLSADLIDDGFRLRYVLPERWPGLIVGISVLAADGTTILTANTAQIGFELPGRPLEYEAMVRLPFAVEPAGPAVYPDPARNGFVSVPCTWSVAPAGPIAEVDPAAERQLLMAGYAR